MIKRLKRHDMAAFEEVVNTYKNYVGAVVRSKISASMEPEDVEEVVADVFFALWKQHDKLNPDKGSIKNYLGVIARNMAVNKLRNYKNTVALEEDMELQGSASPENEFLDKEARSNLTAEIALLKSPDREIFIRYHMDGESINDIASELKLNPNTVKAKLARARKKLKKQLSERGYCYEG